MPAIGQAPAVTPALLAVAHGTRNPAGTATIEALLDRVRALRPRLTVRAAYLEAAAPSFRTAVRDITGPVVVVPLLLAAGYHAAVDIPGAVAASQRDATAGPVRIAPALGPHPLLAEALIDRLREAGWRAGDAVVLAAAGSSDPAGAVATAAQAELLAALTGGPVVAAYASTVAPTGADAVAELRSRGAGRVLAASYLLAPGHFHTQLRTLGADAVTEPLGGHPAVARLVLARYDHARLP